MLKNVTELGFEHVSGALETSSLTLLPGGKSFCKFIQEVHVKCPHAIGKI